MKSITRHLITGLGLAAFASSANGAALIYEPFAQDFSVNSDLNGKTGGSGLTPNTWSDNGTVTVQAESLSYGNLEHTGGQARLVTSGGTDAFITTTNVLATNGLLNDGSTLWFSMMYRKEGGGGSNEKSGFAFGTDRLDGAFNGTNMVSTNGGNGLGFIANNDNLTAARWSGGGNGTTGLGGFDITPGIETLPQTVFIVGRIQWGAALADETLTLWLQDTGTLDGSTAPTGTGSVQTLADVSQSAFNTISMTVRNAGGDQIYDEIRFGATYADVAPVPEPSAALLGGLGFLALLRRRR